MNKINKILIANRGEIAVRIMRSAKELGIKTVAIFSDVDENSIHVRYADEAYCVGPSKASESYLNQEKVIEVALKSKADAIHPGYGFLSENAEFAKRVADHGITFIGPSPEAIKLMGEKLMARQLAKEHNIPLVPGSKSVIKDIKEGKRIANEIGYPVMIKASAGGGGKGMRVVYEEDELESQMERAMSEASSSFGNPDVFIEKFVQSPKHIEVQVMGDQQGNVVYIFERECSIQRRHQKVIEEAPSSIKNEELRKKLGEVAVKVAKACNYYNAGTVEFMVDKDMNFFFLEMNTRLQVEHPVTELISGLDLVKEQINISEGNKLSFTQNDVKMVGHSIEVRVYAEDPYQNFLPNTGKLETYKIPKGPGIRVDDGYEEGMEVSVYYDPMISKLISYGKDREEAIQRMLRGMKEYKISGVQTTLPFCEFVLNHPEFKDGSFTTKFIESNYNDDSLSNTAPEEYRRIAAAFAGIFFQDKKEDLIPLEQQSNWKLRSRF